MKNEITNSSDFILYMSSDGEVKVDVMLQNESVWLTQSAMQELFGRAKSTISEHIKNVFEEGELDQLSTVRKYRTVQIEGKREVERELEYYNLDVIISVGYSVKSHRGTQFRIWATSVLREYIIKGFALDDDRLKQGETIFGKDYFRELLDRIREIRTSKRRFYQKITDIYAQCSIDYDAAAPVTKDFYATVQNKLHWAITGNTAAEIIYKRADATKPLMGLKTYKNAPDGKVIKKDTTVAKNYLEEKELKDLNRLVTMYLDFAELQAERQIAMKMQDWMTRLDAFLSFNEYDILHNAGTVKAKVAKALAEKKFEKFRVQQDQDYISDFDKEIKKINRKTK